ncbi:MAG: nucleotidyltransferase family protein [Candidatus Eremiobacteraeota bacterium]|nr:nucleotidyltransferase family protein [Candidatus Eremiobacteraeota bacterium]
MKRRIMWSLVSPDEPQDDFRNDNAATVGVVRPCSEYLDVLRAHRQQLEKLGVTRIAIFGSVVHGEARPDSDIDILVDLDPNANVSLMGLGHIWGDLHEMLARDIDLVCRDRIHPMLRERILAEAVDAF